MSRLEILNLYFSFSKARKISRDAGLGKAKEKLSDGIRLAKSKLSDVESKL